MSGAGSTLGGVAVAACAACCNAGATALQAAEARRSPRERPAGLSLLARLMQRPRWLAGIALLALAWPLQVLALALASLTVVQPVLSTSLLVLLAIGARLLHERVGPREALGVLAIIGGVVVVVLAAPHESVRHAGSWPLVAVVLGLCVLTGLGHLAGRRGGARLGLVLVLVAGLGFAGSDFAAKLLSGAAALGSWGAAAGWLAASVALGVLGLLDENAALQRRPATDVAPIVAAMKVPVPVILALSLGGEGWGPLGGGVVLLGIACVSAGAAIIASSPLLAGASGGAQAEAGGRRGAEVGAGREP